MGLLDGVVNQLKATNEVLKQRLDVERQVLVELKKQTAIQQQIQLVLKEIQIELKPAPATNLVFSLGKPEDQK